MGKRIAPLVTELAYNDPQAGTVGSTKPEQGISQALPTALGPRPCTSPSPALNWRLPEGAELSRQPELPSLGSLGSGRLR